MTNIILGDCLDVLKTLPENSIDSLVTDPPYFLTGSSGSGFMGKSWDSLSIENAIVESYFKLMKIVLNMDEASTAQDRVNTLKSESPALSVKNQSSQLPLDFVPALVLTKQEALVLCREMLPSHTTVIENLPDHAVFVGNSLFTEAGDRNIARNIVDTLKENPMWLEQTTTFISTEKTESAKNSTEEKSGTSLESQSTQETDTVAESVEQSAQNTISNATTSSPIEFQTTIQKIISLPCVKAVIKQCTSSQNLIPLLSVAFHYKWSKEVLRVLKPGAYGLVFGGTRTYHRLVSALEDSGFEIRDCVMWIHGQGFPKSLSVSKQLEKQGYPEEAEKWSGFGTALKPAYEPIVLIRRPLSEKTVASNVLKHGTGGLNIDESRIKMQSGDTSSSLRPCRLRGDKTDHKDAIFGSKNDSYQNNTEGASLGRFPSHLVLDEEAASLLDEQSGQLVSKWGKQKVCHEGEDSIFGLSVPDDVNKYSGDKGGASRFFKVFENSVEHAIQSECSSTNANNAILNSKTSQAIEKIASTIFAAENAPLFIDLANRYLTAKFAVTSAISTEIDSVREVVKTLFRKDLQSLLCLDFIKEHKDLILLLSPAVIAGLQENIDIMKIIPDQKLLYGFALHVTDAITSLVNQESAENINHVQTRFRYAPKASKSDKGDGNVHPTVKSTKLMQYLIKLITPPNGVVLDCFMGSGSTGVSAKRAGFQFIGIEKEPEYFEIASNRLKAI